MRRELAPRLRTLRAQHALLCSWSLDHHLKTHVERTSSLVHIFASVFGLQGNPLEHLVAASTLHDLGKALLDPRILLKPTALDDDEWRHVRLHTVHGHRLLRPFSSSPLLRLARDLALHHHERWDGTGYPHGLRGLAIPWHARLLSVVDVYDALRTPRPYKNALSHEQACHILLRGNSRTQPSHFDPQFLGVFERCHQALQRAYDAFTPVDEPPWPCP